MNKTPFRRTRVAGAIAGLACALGAGHAFGAAFALQETCGSGLGNAYAGGAAAAEDACTVWSNPAGMSRFSKNQVVGATEIITPSFKFQNGNSQPALNQPLGNNGGDAGSTVAVPNVYLVMPINNQWRLAWVSTFRSASSPTTTAVGSGAIRLRARRSRR